MKQHYRQKFARVDDLDRLISMEESDRRKELKMEERQISFLFANFSEATLQAEDNNIRRQRTRAQVRCSCTRTGFRPRFRLVSVSGFR